MSVILTLATRGVAFSQMEGGVGGGAGGSPQDAWDTDRTYDELRSEKKIPSPAQTEAPNELAVGANLVKQSEFSAAIPHLELALSKDPNNAVTLIYLGFSHRMIGAWVLGDARDSEFEKALGYYRRALPIDPENRLLHEYLGKLYLLMKDQESAEDEMKTLETLCPSGCVERDTLSGVLLAYKASMTPLSATPPATQPQAK
jgi:tetratricopeptide (TPR) repeat protein